MAGKKEKVDSRDVFEKALDWAEDHPQVTATALGGLVGRAVGSRVGRLKHDTDASFAATRKFAKNFGTGIGGVSGFLVGTAGEGGRQEALKKKAKRK